MKKVVVFGGAGFLGTYLCEELKKRGYQVIAADVHPSEHLNGIEYVTCNILNKEEVSATLANNTYAVYNLAGFANLDKAIHYPTQTFNLNVIGNLQVLEACVEHKVEHVVYASSAYAMSEKGSFYGISKLTSEKILKEFNKRYGLTYTIVRYGSVYSERAFENNYIYNLVKEALNTGVINHAGDGEEIREYIHAADAARLSADMLEKPEYRNENFMLTGVERMKRKEVFEMINEISGGKLQINLTKDGYDHHYKTTPYTFQPESSKKLVANPFIDMGQGIVECMKSISTTHEE